MFILSFCTHIFYMQSLLFCPWLQSRLGLAAVPSEHVKTGVKSKPLSPMWYFTGQKQASRGAGLGRFEDEDHLLFPGTRNTHHRLLGGIDCGKACTLQR